jgi:hypothetical protein
MDLHPHFGGRAICHRRPQGLREIVKLGGRFHSGSMAERYDDQRAR